MVAACMIQNLAPDCLPAALKTCEESFLAPHSSALFDSKPNPETAVWCAAALSKASQTSKSPAKSGDLTQEQAQDQINTLVAACLIGKRPTECISVTRGVCFYYELAPIKAGWFSPKPVSKTMEWCGQAEMTAWALTQADIQKIKDRLGDRPEWRDFERQEAAWQAFMQKRGPYGTYDADHAFFGDPSEYLLPLVAAHAIQVAKIAASGRVLQHRRWGAKRLRPDQAETMIRPITPTDAPALLTFLRALAVRGQRHHRLHPRNPHRRPDQNPPPRRHPPPGHGPLLPRLLDPPGRAGPLHSGPLRRPRGPWHWSRPRPHRRHAAAPNLGRPLHHAWRQPGQCPGPPRFYRKTGFTSRGYGMMILEVNALKDQ